MSSRRAETGDRTQWSNRSDRIRRVQRAIARWFAQHQRDLPWRKTFDPYRILVSEVMLQQTQVDRVVPKYQAFLRRFPTVRVLARATPREVLLAWAGLGYNRRALYLHRAARLIVERFAGRVPADPERLRLLPGVGAYTAAAVATFATGVPRVMADTNVTRVIGRLFGGHPLPRRLRTGRGLLALVERTMPQRPVAGLEPALWGHALMDFGALVCRAKPRCAVCPLRQWCRAYPAFQGVSPVQRSHTSDRPYRSRPVPDRIIRGKMLALVRSRDPRPVPRSAFRPLLAGRPGKDCRRLLRGLVAEGLLELVSPQGSVRLPRGGS